MDKILKSIPPQLEAAEALENSTLNFTPTNKNVPPNKNIVPQRFSHVSKKRKVIKNNASSQDDTDTTILNIILDQKNSHTPAN